MPRIPAPQDGYLFLDEAKFHAVVPGDGAPDGHGPRAISVRRRARTRWNPLIVFMLLAWRVSCCYQSGRRDLPINSHVRRLAETVLATAAAVGAVVALTGEVAAQTGGWLLVAPPAVSEKRALMKVYAAGSDAEVQAAVASLPGEEQVRLVTRVYEILTMPTVAERTEALFDALQDAAAPVSRWRRVETFDSAASCERERQRALQSFERAAERVRATSPEGDELSVEEWTIFEGLAACRSSRCVPESTYLSR